MKIEVAESEQVMDAEIGNLSMLYTNDMAYRVLNDTTDGLVIPELDRRVIMKIDVRESDQAMDVEIGRISMLYSTDTGYIVLDDTTDGLVIPESSDKRIGL